MLQQRTENWFVRVIVQMEFDIIITMILQNTFSRFKLFLMESFDTYLRYVGNKQDNFEHLKPYSEFSLLACICSFQCNTINFKH